MTADNNQTEQVILTAAKSVFMKRGFAAARMQEIADEAGINRALLHYYFRSKEKLFEKIFSEAIGNILPGVKEIIDSDAALFEKIEQITARYIQFATEQPYLPAFVIQELNQHPDKIQMLFKESNNLPDPRKLVKQIDEEVKAGNIIPIQPAHLLVNVIALCVFPFVAKPIIHLVFGLSEEGFKNFIQERKKIVAQTIINSIKKH
ncbi:MAG TPA: TetR/AcrR family transcriptional regulator [Flavipsychrobacter sp.]|nr:TetR/AcrR family transcriptional regulator [Flavipsychrobacter sp.]